MNRLRTVAIALGFLVGIAASRLAPVDAWADRNSGGTYTLPSGNPVVSGTTITSTWANNTLNDIATNLTSSLDRAGRGAMTAPLQLASGTSSAPGLTFSAETSTGLYRFGSNDARMQVAATTRQKWTSTGAEFPTELVTFSGPGDGGPAVYVSNSLGRAVSAIGGGSSVGLYSEGGADAGWGVIGVAGVSAPSGSTGGNGVAGYGSSGNYANGGNGVVGFAGGQIGGYSDGAGVVGIARDAVNAGITSSTYTGGLSGISVTDFAITGETTGGTAAYLTATTGTAISGYTSSMSARTAYLYSARSTATARAKTLIINGGDIVFESSGGGVVAPNPDAGSSNTLTASNIVKAWGQINLAGPPVLLSGFNVASISCASNVITVNWQNAFTGATAYVVQPTISANDVRASVIHDYSGGSSASNAKFAAFDNAGTIINLCAAVTGYNGFTTAHIDFTAIGHQ